MTRVDADGAWISWRAVGPEGAPPIVLVHALGADITMWQPQIDVLGEDHRLLLVDLRGHGLSGATRPPYSIARLASDALAAAEAAGLDRFHLCGVSIGGQIALWTAIHHPDRVSSIVAANTAARVGTVEFWNNRIAAVRAAGMASMAESVVDRWFDPGFGRHHPLTIADAQRVFAATSPDGYIGGCLALADSDLREDVARIEIPTLLIGGGLDAATPPRETEWLGTRIPTSSVRIIADAAHLSNLERPEAFNAALQEFYAADR